jgi:2-dehydro-3-deoxygluconokinase
VNRKLAPYVDVMLGNEEDFGSALGFQLPEHPRDGSYSNLNTASFKTLIKEVLSQHPNLAAVAMSLRVAKTATLNSWSGLCYYESQFYEATKRDDLEIYDRVGGGDSFASGLIYGFLTGKDPQWSVECGAAHGALAMTTPGDTSMVTLPEVLQLMQGVSARIAR